ncbi:hypothetical protein BTK96_000518 [Burkholderia pyrrocinia]|uniref:hypothetical protein n=1 Tax=Burkholderia sp. IT-111MI5 TaxID=3026439 RepID=UPI002685CFA7|nr:hypothetical protein [Burkholderia pyrrocinia]
MRRIVLCICVHRIALIRLRFPARLPSQPRRTYAPPAIAKIARFAVFALSIAKIII